MAWSGANISAADLLYFDADKPILAGINALDGSQSSKWATTADGSDITATGYEATRAYDRLGHLRTKPNTSGTEFWLQFQLSATVDDFDAVLVWGHSGLDGVLVEARMADDAGWTSNQETIASTTQYTPDHNKRIALMDIQNGAAGESQRFSDVPYFWLRFTKGSAFTPEIGEVWLIRRRQMPHFPRLSYDPNAYGSDQVTRRSRAGVSVVYSNHSGRQDLTASFNPSLTADHNEIKSFIADTGYGSKPFIWMPNPSTAPEEFRVITPPQDPGLGFPFVGFTERQITISGEESYPFQTGDV